MVSMLITQRTANVPETGRGCEVMLICESKTAKENEKLGKLLANIIYILYTHGKWFSGIDHLVKTSYKQRHSSGFIKT